MELTDFNKLSLPECCSSLVSDEEISRVFDIALREDGLEHGDITTMSIVPEGREVSADLVARAPGVLAGLSLLHRAADLSPLSGRLQIDPVRSDGDRVSAGDVLGSVCGAWREVLACERVLLNLLSRLCGVATRTDCFVQAVHAVASGVQVCDSRKTTPGLRHMEKYAVACGGGCLHRVGLDDAVMYKDNHLASIPEADLGSALVDAISMARADRPLRFVCVEVDRLDQLDVVLELDSGLVDIVLLDNMTPDQLRDAVARRDASQRSIALEASGGVTLETIADIAVTGVERIAVGSITHGVKWLDIGMDIHPDGAC
jgi:nicotinate-nucleotide pyrophosphorylase (carboxylating)